MKEQRVATGRRSLRTRGVIAAAVLGVGALLAPAAGQVAGGDRPDGSPKAGFDPADGPAPWSLTRAAERGRPSDVEDRRIDRGALELARDVRGSQRRVDPAQVLSEQSRRGGCAKGYGQPGQCLPVRPPGAGAHAEHEPSAVPRWTCTEVRLLFPTGVAVRGADQLRLDGNRDGTACGPGDA